MRLLLALLVALPIALTASAALAELDGAQLRECRRALAAADRTTREMLRHQGNISVGILHGTFDCLTPLLPTETEEECMESWILADRIRHRGLRDVAQYMLELRCGAGRPVPPRASNGAPRRPR